MSTFDCADCGGTFPDLTDLFGHDPVAEAAEVYLDINPSDMVTVCDDCYARRLAVSSGGDA